MAEQDFNINIRTTADSAGAKQTVAELEAIKRKAAEANAAMSKQAVDAEAKWAKSPLNPNNQGGGPTPPGGGPTGGLTGTAIGVGTIISLVTTAITKWKDFNDELDRAAEKMLQSQEKFRALGESILDMQDAARSAARIGTEPLESSFRRLSGDVIRLKTEMRLLNLPQEGEEWKKLNAQLGVTEGQLNRVTSAIEKAKAAREADKKAFEISAFEAEAAEADKSGDTARAERARQIAEGLKRGIPLGEVRRDEIPTTPAGIGESQAAVDQRERNRKAFLEQQIPKKWEIDPTTGGMKEVPLSIKETNALLRQLLDKWQ